MDASSCLQSEYNIPYSVANLSDKFLERLCSTSYSAAIDAKAKNNSSRGVVRIKHQCHQHHIFKLAFVITSVDELQQFECLLNCLGSMCASSVP